MKSYSQEEVTQKIQHYETQIAIMSEQEIKISAARNFTYDNYDSDSNSEVSNHRELINTCRRVTHHSMMDYEVEGCGTPRM